MPSISARFTPQRQLFWAATSGLEPWKWPAGMFPALPGPAEKHTRKGMGLSNKVPRGAAHLARMVARNGVEMASSMAQRGAREQPQLGIHHVDGRLKFDQAQTVPLSRETFPLRKDDHR